MQELQQRESEWGPGRRRVFWLNLLVFASHQTTPTFHTHTGLAREADAEAAITAELDAARAEAAALPPQLDRLRAAVAAAEAALQARVAGSDEGLRAAADRAAKLRASLAAYEAATGVRWVVPDSERGVPGELGIEFRALDPAAPAAAARLGLRLEDSGLYTVTRCDPPLRRVAALARDLSAKRLEFGAFVRAARAEFRAAAVGR